ncbi:barstar family protein [Nonomuraea sp. NPDC049421]|uniref:barstar family protein n=1 Tax=Nonomuraea sp. NPDC049421 TaxID=3155275 RepID=UPI00342EC16D
MTDVKYALREFRTSGCILTMADMDGFFIGDRSFYEDYECPDETPGHRLSVPLRAAQVSHGWRGRWDEPWRIAGDVQLEIWDRSGRSIGEYDLMSVEITLASPDGDVGEMQATVSLPPHAWAKPVWEAWRVGPPVQLNQWWDIPVGQREGWVEVAQHSMIAKRPHREEIVLDGRGVVDLASFFCAIGEAVHGPGGYFGSNFMALHDCLRCRPSILLHWQDYAVAEEHLSHSVDLEEGPMRWIDIIMGYLSAAGTRVVLE